MAETNPNGANQYQLDPRQKLCWDFYIDPRSETFGNALRSAIKAGYTEGTASQITTENWFIERLRRMNLLTKAEKVLDRTLDFEPVNEEGKIDSNILRVQTDVAKFIASTQGKHQGYSQKTEVDHTTLGDRVTGFSLVVPVEPLQDKAESE